MINFFAPFGPLFLPKGLLCCFAYRQSKNQKVAVEAFRLCPKGLQLLWLRPTLIQSIKAKAKVLHVTLPSGKLF
jgi:hypothetical protein